MFQYFGFIDRSKFLKISKDGIVSNDGPCTLLHWIINELYYGLAKTNLFERFAINLLTPVDKLKK